MTVEQIYAGGQRYSVSGTGYSTEGEILQDDQPIELDQTPALRDCLQCGVLCNDSSLTEEDGQPTNRRRPHRGRFDCGRS